MAHVGVGETGLLWPSNSKLNHKGTSSVSMPSHPRTTRLPPPATYAWHHPTRPPPLQSCPTATATAMCAPPAALAHIALHTNGMREGERTHRKEGCQEGDRILGEDLVDLLDL
jgi:hypothetical protein